MNFKNDDFNNKINIESYTTFKSTDFNSRELDEQHTSPISVRNLMSKNLAINNGKPEKPNKIKNTITKLKVISF